MIPISLSPEDYPNCIAITDSTYADSNGDSSRQKYIQTYQMVAVHFMARSFLIPTKHELGKL
jgi:hypothetical protein